MKKLNHHFMLQLALSFCLIVLPCMAQPIDPDETRYRPGDAIIGATIVRGYGVEWFHVSEGTPLQPIAFDRDEVCGPDTDHEWEETDIDTNYVDYESATWEGTGLLDSTGFTVWWQSFEDTGENGHTITVTVHDKADTPSEDANDDDDHPATGQIALKAYKARAIIEAHLTQHPNGTEDDDDELVERLPGVDGQTQPEECELQFDINYDPITDFHNTATPEATPTTKPTRVTVTGKWDLTTVPDAATLGMGGKLTLQVGYTSEGSLEVAAKDGDSNDGPTSWGSISFTFKGVVGWTSPEIAWGSDEDEAVAHYCMAVADSSDILPKRGYSGMDDSKSLISSPGDPPGPNYTDSFDLAYSEHKTWKTIHDTDTLNGILEIYLFSSIIDKYNNHSSWIRHEIPEDSTVTVYAGFPSYETCASGSEPNADDGFDWNVY